MSGLLSSRIAIRRASVFHSADDSPVLPARTHRTPPYPAVPVVERGEDRNIMRKRGRDDERVEDLVRREEVVERPRREALRDAVRAAHPSVRPCGPAVGSSRYRRRRCHRRRCCRRRAAIVGKHRAAAGAESRAAGGEAGDQDRDGVDSKWEVW